MRGKELKLGFSEKDRKIIRKNHMEETTNKENNWNYITETNLVEGAIKKPTWKKW